MKYLLIILAGLMVWQLISCKTKPEPAAAQPVLDKTQLENKWKTVDSLEKKGLLNSALTEVRLIKEAALKANDSGHLVKAVMHENKYLIQLEEDSAIKALERIEQEISNYPEPAKSVMHSLAGQWYGHYLQNNLWGLRNRTEYTGEPGPDIRTWGIRHFVERILHHYEQSLTWQGLKTAPVENYALLLTEEKNTDHLRPTLYDILMHRALDFYSGTESYLTKPEYGFVITDPAAFSPASSFIKTPFSTTDTLSNAWQALQWYKDLLSFRLEDKGHEAALIDADLKRLRFVFDNIVIERKDSLYIKALDDLSARHAQNAESSLIDYYRAQWLFEQASMWPANKTSAHRYSYNTALEICRRAIAKFPDAYGSQLCRNLITQIESKSISATAESINLPNEELLVQLEYKNLSSLFCKLVRLPEAPRRWRGDNWQGELVLQRLNQLQVVKNWDQSLDDGGDYQPHTTEIPLPALRVGHYALVISDKQDFDVKQSTTGAILFTVSELGFWHIGDQRGSRTVAVINRNSGQPLQGVNVEFFEHRYNPATRKDEENLIGKAVSDVNGFVKGPNENERVVTIRLTRNEDELYEDEGYHVYRYSGRSQNEPVTLFFSDRSIYRPGQKIYFKGYLLEFDRNRIPQAITGKQAEIILYNANGQEQMRKNFISNEYGTIAGHFDLPAGGLTGRMSIGSSHGNNRHVFRVEEYKRPKFEIRFDTLKETPRLNEYVTISGAAKDYAGSPVPNADVKFRVARISSRPWYPYYSRSIWPREEDRQIITTGTSTTGPDGSFAIRFLAKPKAGGDPGLNYRFETTVFITDITGESHELTKSIMLNEQGYEVSIPVLPKISMRELRHLAVTAHNSEGAEIKLNGNVEATQLNGPASHKRDRLWQSPDILTISEDDYIRRFPDYFIPGKDKMDQWEINKVTGKIDVEVNGQGSVNITSVIPVPGYYKLTWIWKDATGKELEISQYAMVYDERQKLPGPDIIEVAFENKAYQPGETPVINLLTGLNDPPKSLRIVAGREENQQIAWHPLPAYNNKSIEITERDRGGIYFYQLTAYNNRLVRSDNFIDVPWTNKELTVDLKTWRDKLEPGEEETWTLSVKGSKKDAVTAEMLLSMYDASLDAFVPHEWKMNLFPRTMPKIQISGSETRPAQYWGLTFHWFEEIRDIPYRQYRDINVYGYYPEGSFPYYPGYPVIEELAAEYDVKRDVRTLAQAPTAVDMTGAAANKEITQPAEKTSQAAPTSLRSALDETVFFYPQITTDKEGNLSFSFKMKEGLTRWKFQALAHTKELAHGYTKAELVTQKQFMVFPNPPRFFREGDTIAFQIKTTNLTSSELNGSAQLKIIDLVTNEDVTNKWKITGDPKSLHIAANGTFPLSWKVVVPRKWTHPVKYQVFATAGSFTDGEEAFLPVVTNRLLITETLPLPVKAKEKRTFVFKSMQNKSATMDPHQYVVEMTTSPAWYAVQALPYLMEYPHECSEQVFNRLYGNSLASHIANTYPAIRQVYETWRATNDDALLSNLQKNQELKSAMLEETPWVRDALGEEAQKKDIALLFDVNRMRSESQQAVAKLRRMQLSNGGWPWFPGGRDNWYITQYIVEGFGHLRKMGAEIRAEDPQDMIRLAVNYTDARIIEWYDELKRSADNGKTKLEDHHIGPMQVHFVYARSFFGEIERSQKLNAVIDYIKTQSEKYWLEHGIYDQGLMALGFYRLSPDNGLSKEILASLRERTIVDEELGRYWKMAPGFYWYQAPVELQSLMIELYQDMDVPQEEIDELRVWLLKQKQTTRWNSTKATSAAVYALLIHPDAWLDAKGIVEVRLGGQEVIGQSTPAEPGTGYVKLTWEGEDIKDNWSAITVENPNNHIAWGAAYWQYWEDIDKVKSPVEDNPVQVSRQLLIATQSDRGEISNPAAPRNLKVGDKLIVRLVIESDRAMEFVHLKDLRASGFEPMDVISTYRWRNGIGYYQSTKDLATHFFFDYLPRGKFVIEYPVTVAQAGAYSEGVASIQCMYAPEFADHSEGQRVMAN